MIRYGYIRFAQVPERVSTTSYVVLIVGNSKSNHSGAQGTFRGHTNLMFEYISRVHTYVVAHLLPGSPRMRQTERMLCLFIRDQRIQYLCLCVYICVCVCVCVCMYSMQYIYMCMGVFVEIQNGSPPGLVRAAAAAAASGAAA